MSALCRFALIFHLLGSAAPAADPVVDLRLLRMDQKTAGLLEKALQDGALDAAGIEEKLDALVKNRTLTELARFRRAFAPHGERLEFEKDRADIKVADGEVLPGGLSLEAEPTVGPNGLVDFRFLLRRAVKEGRDRIEAERTNTSSVLPGGRWEILSDWGDEKQATLLIARFTGVDTGGEASSNRMTQVQFRSELRWCERPDMMTFARATEETRAKATAWLLARSRPIATSGIRVRGGQRCEQGNVLEWIHDNGNGWDTAELGWSLEYQTAIGPDGKLIDLQMKSSWHPRDAKAAPSTPDYTFGIATTTRSGTTLVIEPKTMPGNGTVAIPVIFLTPTVFTLAEPEKAATWTQLPEGDNIGLVIYPVHPSLMRKLVALAATKPGMNPNVFPDLPLKDVLQGMGMEFPAGTAASFDASEGTVMLSHKRQGHERFQAILEQNGLRAPKGD